MNFDELLLLYERHRNDRAVIAKALHATPELIDQWQREAERMANELIIDTGGPQNISG
jgi:hypothetical protein